MSSQPYRAFDSFEAQRKAKKRAELLEKMHYHESVQEEEKAAGYRNEAGLIEDELTKNQFSMDGKALAPKKAGAGKPKGK